MPVSDLARFKHKQVKPGLSPFLEGLDYEVLF